MTKEYNVIGSNFTGVMIFKYGLNGILNSFELVDADEMSKEQVRWLFSGHFPYREQQLSHFRTIKTFTVSEGKIDMSFETFWNTYQNKVKRSMAIKAWDKISDPEKIAALAGIKPYFNYLKRKRGIDKAHPSTYLNQKYWDSDWGSVH